MMALPDNSIDRVPARWVVAAILIYIAALTLLRLSLSPFLEIDEAQFVGAVDLRFIYDNSHPPLYNWLVRAALEATGWNWALSVALVKALLLAATHLLLFDAARRVAGVGAGLVTLAAAALMPQVSWMSAHTLAHSVLVMAGAAGVLHALSLMLTRPGLWPAIWLGVAVSIGALAKYSFGLLVAPLAIVMIADPVMRHRVGIFGAITVLATVTVLAGPSLVRAVQQPQASTHRVKELFADGPLTSIEMPGLGVEGVLALLVSVAASGGIVIAATILLRGLPAPGPARALRRVLVRTLVLGIGGFALVVLGAGMTAVHERYLTPLLMVLPLIAGLTIRHYRQWFVVAGALAFVAVLPGMVGMVAFDKHRFARPYAAYGAALADALPVGRIAVASPYPDLAANVALALTREGRAAAVVGDRLAPAPRLYLRVWRGSGELPVTSFPPPPGLCRHSDVSLPGRLRNFDGRDWPARAEVYTACTDLDRASMRSTRPSRSTIPL